MIVTAMLVLAQAATAETRAAAPAGEPARMVCKRQALTGTRFARKICYTAADWDAKAEADRRALAEMTSNTVQRDSGRN